MPELPEVEVVRVGLAPAVNGATVTGVEVFDARSLKRHISLIEQQSGDIAQGHGRTLDAATQQLRAADFEKRLTGVTLGQAVRRGKFLWIHIEGSSSVLFGHLAMSGQLLLRGIDAPDDKNVRIRIWLNHPEHGELRIDFADQRRFGSLAIDELVATDDSHPGGLGTELPLIPQQAGHIARDPLDPAFQQDAAVRGLRQKSLPIKMALLDQRILSGVGNIYADEALWAARIHPELPANQVSARRLNELLTAVQFVFQKALAEGGTSFDAQYVNVNGEAGYFAHSLNAYGRSGKPCNRCGETLKRSEVIDRSSVFCPVCQAKRRRRG